MQFIKTKCVLENKNCKAPGLILFFCKSEKIEPQKRTIWSTMVHIKQDGEGHNISKGW